MADLAEISTIARNYLRDFPRFFQVTRSPVGKTYDLSHMNIDTTSLYVATVSGGTPTEITSDDYDLDARNGVIRLHNAITGVDSLIVEGTHYEWLTPDDLDFYT